MEPFRFIGVFNTNKSCCMNTDFFLLVLVLGQEIFHFKYIYSDYFGIQKFSIDKTSPSG